MRYYTCACECMFDEPVECFFVSAENYRFPSLDKFGSTDYAMSFKTLLLM